MNRLLFIDDDPQAQKTLKMVLAERYSLYSAFTAASGLAMLDDIDPDLVLLDIDLPDGSGLDVLAEILQRSTPPPVIMVAGFKIRY